MCFSTWLNCIYKLFWFQLYSSSLGFTNHQVLLITLRYMHVLMFELLITLLGDLDCVEYKGVSYGIIFLDGTKVLDINFKSN